MSLVPSRCVPEYTGFLQNIRVNTTEYVDQYCNPPVENIPEVMTLRFEVAELEASSKALPQAYNPQLRTSQLNNSLYATRNIQPSADPNGVTLKPYKK
eukprot:CAMPEP_0202864564 /NCGR_PEP_ID=MMETSP1391-20130828/4757_1 /ASSEMBLY_ACC=CAM_ASM_000867 /TAXON_ID=1034604 /ORGANISM="Chlamydomonas leiostraca, Strain SAG 11-49" /LENGTH=97 /DNA_ID=CAMNT_0049544321 /DNA_START=84 /DNA_END=377 /DNA_ORIENTATION=+